MAWWRKQSAPTPRSRWNQDDYHTAFAATSKAQIEQGVSPWQTPWTPAARRRPENIQTGTPYRGSNSVYLSVTQTAKGYRDHRWATYKQIHDMGGQVRTGEQAAHVLFYKFDDQQEKAGAVEQEQTRPPMVRVRGPSSRPVSGSVSAGDRPDAAVQRHGLDPHGAGALTQPLGLCSRRAAGEGIRLIAWL